MKSVFLFGILFIGVQFFGRAQDTLYHFWFTIDNKEQIDKLTRVISIDQVVANKVTAYANTLELQAFQSFNIPFHFIPESNSSKALIMAVTPSEMSNWDRYPTYETYELMMQQFAASYPDICKWVEIGTLSSGRKLLALCISDHINDTSEMEPQLLYTGTMHGDEVAGYILLLRLIDYLLTNYQNEAIPGITELINHSAIWINPLANPNGTYRTGNHTIFGAIRYNGNFVDLNRNFPDPAAGLHPDGNSWQEETQLMMDFSDRIPFNLSANFHSGTEVVNYPWDTWSRLSADDLWWKYVGGNYRDTVHAYCPSGYFNDLDNGLTNGYLWYRITGGRQDYMNYFKHAREMTVELTTTKLYPVSELNNLWSYHRSALLSYLYEGLNGIQGRVTDPFGQPVAATIRVLDHDKDESQVFSLSSNGYFARYLKGGNYSLEISAEGFAPEIIHNITLIDGQPTSIQIVLKKTQPLLCIETDSINVLEPTESLYTHHILLSNCGNDTLIYTIKIDDDSLNNWINIKDFTGKLLQGATDTLKLIFDSHSLPSGVYQTQIKIFSTDTLFIPIEFVVVDFPEIEIALNDTFIYLVKNEIVSNKLYFKNPGNSPKTVFLSDENSWLTFSSDTLLLNPHDSLTIDMYVDGEKLPLGFHSTNLKIESGVINELPLELLVDTLPLLRLSKNFERFEMLRNQSINDTLVLWNKGGGVAEFLVSSTQPWLQPFKNKVLIKSQFSDTLFYNIQTTKMGTGSYSGSLIFTNERDTLECFIQLLLDTLPEGIIDTQNRLIEVYSGSVKYDTLKIKNVGGSKYPFQVSLTENAEITAIYFEPAEGSVSAGDSISVTIAIDARKLSAGNYATEIICNQQRIPLDIKVLEFPILHVLPTSFVFELQSGEILSDTLYFVNQVNMEIECQLKLQNGFDWITFTKQPFFVPGNQTYLQPIIFDTKNLETGKYRNFLEVQTFQSTRIPIEITILPSIK